MIKKFLEKLGFNFLDTEIRNSQTPEFTILVNGYGEYIVKCSTAGIAPGSVYRGILLSKTYGNITQAENAIVEYQEHMIKRKFVEVKRIY